VLRILVVYHGAVMVWLHSVFLSEIVTVRSLVQAAGRVAARYRHHIQYGGWQKSVALHIGILSLKQNFALRSFGARKVVQ
jgi:hypothetical protein